MSFWLLGSWQALVICLSIPPISTILLRRNPRWNWCFVGWCNFAAYIIWCYTVAEHTACGDVHCRGLLHRCEWRRRGSEAVSPKFGKYKISLWTNIWWIYLYNKLAKLWRKASQVLWKNTFLGNTLWEKHQCCLPLSFIEGRFYCWEIVRDVITTRRHKYHYQGSQVTRVRNFFSP